MAEQATVFAIGPSAGSHFKAAVAGLAFGQMILDDLMSGKLLPGANNSN